MDSQQIYQASKDYIGHYSTTKEATNLISKTVVSNIFARLIGGNFIVRAGIFLILHCFDVDFYGLIGNICEDVTALFNTHGKQLSPDMVQERVDHHVDAAFAGKSAENAAQKAQQFAEEDSSLAAAGSASLSLLKLSFLRQKNKSAKISIAAKPSATAAAVQTLSKGKEVVKKGFKGTLGGIFKVLLGGMGLTLFADFVKSSLFGMPSPLAEAFHFDMGPSFYPTVSSQTKYPLNPSYSVGYESSPIVVTGVENDYNSILNLLQSWANQIYTNVPANMVSRSMKVNDLIKKIIEINSLRPSANDLLLPYQFSSKKQIVDYFIDDVAKLDSIPAAKTSARKIIFKEIIKQN